MPDKEDKSALYICPIDGNGCGQLLTEPETALVRALLFKVRRCRWCGNAVRVAKCSFEGCVKVATQQDWDRIQDIMIPFCEDHCYNGQLNSLVREFTDIEEATQKYRDLHERKRKTS